MVTSHGKGYMADHIFLLHIYCIAYWSPQFLYLSISAIVIGFFPPPSTFILHFHSPQGVLFTICAYSATLCNNLHCFSSSFSNIISFIPLSIPFVSFLSNILGKYLPLIPIPSLISIRLWSTLTLESLGSARPHPNCNSILSAPHRGFCSHSWHRQSLQAR